MIIKHYETAKTIPFRLRPVGHAPLPADPPALLGVHPFCHRPEEPPGGPVCYGFCGVPSGFRGREFCVEKRNKW